MRILRTPDERFAGLPDFPYAPHYADGLTAFESLRIHYLDEGPSDADQTFLCLHGEPTWSYLYRRMIPDFLAAGGRVIAPDFAGFGRSDKPEDDGVYTFDFHRDMLLALIRRLDLNNITLVVQDWGGLLGLTLPMELPDRFSRLLVMNTALATGEAPSEGFVQWRAFVAANPDLAVGRLMKRSCPHLSEAETAAYDAPFPDMAYKAGVRRFPQMVMTEPGMDGVEASRKASAFWRDEWDGRSFMAIGVADPVLGAPVMEKLRAGIRGCPEPLMLPNAGHFVQEWGEEVARAALASFSA